MLLEHVLNLTADLQGHISFKKKLFTGAVHFDTAVHT